MFSLKHSVSPLAALVVFAASLSLAGCGSPNAIVPLLRLPQVPTLLMAEQERSFQW